MISRDKYDEITRNVEKKANAMFEPKQDDIDTMTRNVDKRLQTIKETKASDETHKDTKIDIALLAKRIEEKLNNLETITNSLEEVHDEINKTIYDFSDLVGQIDAKLKELDAKEALEKKIPAITDKVNEKLNYMLEFNDEKEVDKTIYDLSEISKLVNDTIAKLEKDKVKRAQKAKYCNMAREKARKERDQKKKAYCRNKTNKINSK